MGAEKNDPAIEEEEWDNEEDAGGASGADEGKGDKGTNAKQVQNTGRQFTQAQVEKIMTKEKSQGRNAALRELGIDPNNAKAVEAVKTFLASQKTDSELADERIAESAKKTAESEHRALVAEAKAEAMQRGIKPQYVEDAVLIALPKVSDDSDFATVMGELKTKYPSWFGEEDEEDEDEGKNKGQQSKGGKDVKSAGKKGTGSSVKSSGDKGGKEEQSLGQRLAAQRKANTPKHSYWGNAKES